MRAFSWLAGGLVVVALGLSGLSVVRAHSTSLSPASSLAQVGHLDFEAPVATPTAQTVALTPAPSLAATRTAAPAKAAAPVRRAAPVSKPIPRSSIVIGSAQQVLINRDRAAHGLGPLTWSSCLASVARSNAARMARQGYISHTNGVYADLACHLGSRSGENVGWWSGGVNDSQINTMFMNSPEHRANILGPYHYVATAWVVAPDGRGYIAVEFS
jgi:uncharacterized protein YkwD